MKTKKKHKAQAAQRSSHRRAPAKMKLRDIGNTSRNEEETPLEIFRKRERPGVLSEEGEPRGETGISENQPYDVTSEGDEQGQREEK